MSMQKQEQLLGVLGVILMAIGIAQGEQAQDYSDYSYQALYEQDSASYDSAYSSYDPTINDVIVSPRTGKYRGILPTQITYEALGPMKAKNGEGHVHMQNWMTKFTMWGKEDARWRLMVDSAFRMTWIHGKGDADVDMDRLYSIWLTGTAGYRLTDKTTIIGSVTPQLSSDFDTWVGRDLSLGANLLVNIVPSDNVSWMLGIAYAPQLGHNPWIPVVGVDWQFAPAWRFQLQGTRMAVMNKVSDRFSWGPFVSVLSGTWTVKHERANQRFIWLSYATGVAFNVGLGHFDGAELRFISDIGCTPYNSARYKTSDGRHQLKRLRFDTGAYVRLGLQLDY